MTFLKSKRISEYITFFQSLVWLAGERLFVSLLIVIFISLIAGAAIFYQYAVLAPKAEAQIQKEIIQFERARFEDLVAEWDARQAKFDSALQKEYPELFNR